MQIINFGSLNLDHSYRVPHTALEGETLSALDYTRSAGGKGLNQSIALARAGAQVVHAGCIGFGGEGLAKLLEEAGADTSRLLQVNAPQGHAVIQVSDNGSNCIVIYGGSNRLLTESYVDSVLQDVAADDYVIVQNEISCVNYILSSAHAKGCTVVFNASPVDKTLFAMNLEAVDWLIINEVEGAALSNQTQSAEILTVLRQKYSKMGIVLTLGAEGSVCCCGDQIVRQEALPTHVVDTTGAGDTFLGYFIAGLASGAGLPDAMREASAASALAISVRGAAAAIPARNCVQEYLHLL